MIADNVEHVPIGEMTSREYSMLIDAIQDAMIDKIRSNFKEKLRDVMPTDLVENSLGGDTIVINYDLKIECDCIMEFIRTMRAR